ncbi:MAG: 3'(2'),5'-bisphosphate nucleotidase CysQ [Rhodobacteraceae bacterium]|nr:3'(2'),5'-bisphosphate nucleotidase CysQ [Paracoccaceae bacterium]MBR9821446.1 3'(2'),5'-bisphosphate nucleotidase CysQ [Paracoccaceae bacterium]
MPAAETQALQQEALADLALLTEAARVAGEIALAHRARGFDVTEKPDGQGPVTDADLAVDAALHTRLREARPGYGWLSEESPDDPARLEHEHVFIIDPIDGTRAFMAEGNTAWAHSLAVTRNGVVTAAVVFLPAKDSLYAAALGGGATLNGAPIRATARAALAGARLLAAKPNYAPANWRGPVPEVARHYRPSLAYRLSSVAEGRFDAMLTLRPSWEWDIAAGSLIVEEAGARVTDRSGAALRFNTPRALLDGVVAAGPALHGLILDQLAPDAPRDPLPPLRD